MSAHVEWVGAAGAEVEVLGPDWTDAYGTAVDDGNVGLAIGAPGNSDYVVVEGTRDELLGLVARVLRAIDRGPGDVTL